MDIGTWLKKKDIHVPYLNPAPEPMRRQVEKAKINGLGDMDNYDEITSPLTLECRLTEEGETQYQNNTQTALNDLKSFDYWDDNVRGIGFVSNTTTLTCRIVPQEELETEACINKYPFLTGSQLSCWRRVHLSGELFTSNQNAEATAKPKK